MTENVIQRIEERVTMLLAELDGLQREVTQLRSENAMLKNEKEHVSRKLQGLIALFDTVNTVESLQSILLPHGELANLTT